MPNPFGEDSGRPLSHDLIDGTINQVMILVRKATDAELAEIHDKLIEEQDKRLKQAERNLAIMRKAFGVPKQPLARSEPTRSTTKNSANSTKTSKPRKTKAPKTKRTPRGRAKEMILTCLKDAPRTRKQVMDHFREHGLPANSVPTLLTRLKKSGDIEYNDENNEYSTADNTPAASGT
jgi:hypothetical protein